MKRNFIAVVAIVAAIWSLVSCGKPEVAAGSWTARFDPTQKSVNVAFGSKNVFDGIYASYKLEDGRSVTTRDYDRSRAEVVELSDGFGDASVLRITYTDGELPTLVQSFHLYADRRYLLTEFTLDGGGQPVASNYMAPVNIDRGGMNLGANPGAILGEGEARALFIPYDNDRWVRYASRPLASGGLRSYEVTSIFDNATRRGVVIGSVEHDNWKTAVDIGASTDAEAGSVVCFGGVADSLTRDVKAHGFLRGATIKSPRVMVGYFDDWRGGLEAFGEANAIVAPPKAWDGGVPFGWNSWGVLKFDLDGADAVEVSDYFAKNLQPGGFANADGTVVIGLDSGWNSFTEEELKAFVQRCRDNGQVPGVYWTPFTDWGKRGNRRVENATEYKWSDIWLRADGRPQELDGAYAIDPTHPAVEQRMRATSELFHRLGFKYLKTDFMTHGAFEADGWYDKSIQTGTQAYNHGMKLMDKYFGDMYINLSISPIFPARYAQSRRIACDAWNKIKDTEYTMNALSYGWWLDRVYQYNDADHVVLAGATEGENRARVTSAVITGMFIAGDDFSADGSAEGRARAAKYLTNRAVNAVATGESFRPVEGDGARSENRFVRVEADGSIYYAVFNYSAEPLTETIPLERLGLDPAEARSARELWSGAEVDSSAPHTVAAKDAAIFHISSKGLH